MLNALSLTSKAQASPAHPLVYCLDAVATSLYRMSRRILGHWKRFSRWEFWPPYLFYPPVALYIAYLGIKYRDWTLFTAANPAIPASGFVGESKHQILQNLKTAARWLPHSTLLASGSPTLRLANAAEFMRQNKLQFPVVAKPDVGQRGSGVCIIRTFERLREYLTHAPFPVIVQEYIPGEEYGVFYYRRPGDRRGRIFSVTEKRMPVLIGDGKRTLEELILADDRAVCMSDFYLRKNSGRINEVPAVGEKVQLVEIGTHCRGAIFLDGSETITQELEAVIDQIAQSFEGFFFGRFDIRVPSRLDFMKGRNLKVVELNGVTSEATHIYDSKMSLGAAYRVLFAQWKIAFEIGHINRERGFRAAPVRELLRAVFEYRRLAQCYPE